MKLEMKDLNKQYCVEEYDKNGVLSKFEIVCPRPS